MNKYWYLSVLLCLASCGQWQKAALKQDRCLDPALLYRAADQRLVEQDLFASAFACQQESLTEVALISLGRIGGAQAVELISPYLQSNNARLREVAAFAVGISGVQQVGQDLIRALQQETNGKAKKAMIMAIANLGHPQLLAISNKIIAQSNDYQLVNGALQGLGIASLFHPDALSELELLEPEKVIERLYQPKTALAASFLLARIPLLEKPQVKDLIELLPSLEPPVQAHLLRALSALELSEVVDLLIKQTGSSELGPRINAIRGLAKVKAPSVEVQALLNRLAQSDDPILQATAMQSGAKLNQQQLQALLADNKSSWLSAEALLYNYQLDPEQFFEKSWQWALSDSAGANLQRAAINLLGQQANNKRLTQLLTSDKPILQNGARQALGQASPEPTAKALDSPEQLPELPRRVKLFTNRGLIVFELFADTPYTSANFLRLAKSGFYNGSYFHRVIPNFVAQGGGLHGDGSSSVGYSIREELSMRSHETATVGMATSGKDTGGGQFFINLTANLHLDNNYTIFAQVVEGMEVAWQLQQNDQVIRVEID